MGRWYVGRCAGPLTSSRVGAPNGLRAVAAGRPLAAYSAERTRVMAPVTGGWVGVERTSIVPV
jgi:hypothetical protein